MESEEPDSNISNTLDISDSYRDFQIRKRRHPVLITKYNRKPSYQKFLRYNHAMPLYNTSDLNISQRCPCPSKEDISQNSEFCKREITTIHEEVYQCTKPNHNRVTKAKGYQEKVASLTAVVSRLQKMCLEKPEMLQNNLPDETIIRFKAIHIK
ncbi:uncharacterized protein CEXT_286791 [Caerostris extrusa]|uniref:Uncharacterized protein n=1 Tax=Caerostris extrusa TaxID=172846 RepID=A0AAV4TGD4_CAEEX|nr:uncharacterized protein CEXT_286791 [Caerostris extrusa]